ncbi:MAG: iron-containing alcohol dehydrogenase, partial [Ilumatobacteraceae bacterium]
MTFRANGFAVQYGSGLLPTLTDSLGSYAVVTQPEPWAIIEPTLANEPTDVVFAGDLSPAHLEHLVDQFDAEAVVAVGGGSAMDTGKWLHWRRNVPLYSVPSLPSVNACFTRMTALRDRGGIRYEGDAVPERVLVDFDLMRTAPAELLRGGIGDV